MIDKSRVYSFSDGVFAIASTLLIININTPTFQKEFINGRYGDFFQQVIAYVLSFLIIATYWISYHKFFNEIKKIDMPLLWLNIFLLLLIAFIPFPSSIIFNQTIHQNTQILYASSLGLAGLLLTGMWLYAAFHKKKLFMDTISKEFINYNIVRSSIASAIFFISIIISFFSVSLAMYSWLLIFFARVFLRPFYKSGQ